MDAEIMVEDQLPIAVEPVEKPEPSEEEQSQVKKTLAKIASDRNFFKEAFKTMEEDMMLATYGRINKDTWPDDFYNANIIGRHVKQKTAALYAKNPRIVAKRRETLDFAVWDENPDTLQQAMQAIQMHQQSMMAPPVDPMTGMPIQQVGLPPEALAQFQEIIADAQQGMAKRTMVTKWGKTLEILFRHAMREQKPLDFKMGMKKLVRRTTTTGVGYVELAFARDVGLPPVTSSRMSDIRDRVAHLELLQKDATEGEIEALSAEMYELQKSMEALQSEPHVVQREGLIFDYPQSTRVIPDQLTTSLVGFVGARHLTVEYLFTPEEVREQFPDADLERGYTPYKSNWLAENDEDGGERPIATTNSKGETVSRVTGGLVRVYKHFDKPSGLVYYLADGHKGFLRPPTPPDVFTEDFWPVYALTFNDVENEKVLFPPSDARLMLHQQREINRSRQANREHREAARPRFAIRKSAVDDGDKTKLANAQPFDVIEMNLPEGQSINDILQAIKIPGVDPNLYETNPFFSDMQLVVGSQQASLGGIAKATATEAAISESSMAASDGSAIDDLDNFLTMIARAGGQILMKEMTPDYVSKVVGVGAVWPQLDLEEIAQELYLEVEAGSSGKPNQAVEVSNMTQLMPVLMQIPGINPVWLAKQALSRLDDGLDLTEALMAGMPSISAMNAMSAAPPTPQAAAGAAADPTTDPAAQGPQGAMNTPVPQGNPMGGSDPAFGSNQV